MYDDPNEIKQVRVSTKINKYQEEELKEVIAMHGGQVSTHVRHALIKHLADLKAKSKSKETA